MLINNLINFYEKVVYVKILIYNPMNVLQIYYKLC
jgi:hypothetical protein